MVNLPSRLRLQLISIVLLMLPFWSSLVPAQESGARGGSNYYIGLRSPAEAPIPGPGPNRLDAATSETYRIGLGDTLEVAITFGPTKEVKEQPIRSRDHLNISYHFGLPNPNEPYRIQPFDLLNLQFRYSPAPSQPQPNQPSLILTREYPVTPEGDIVLPGINLQLAVKDLTTTDVRQLVRQAYAGFLQDPEVSVSVEPRFEQEQRLREALGANRTEPLLVIVPEDGMVSLPLMDEIKTGGKSVREVGREITRRYRELGYERLTVNVWFNQIADERHAQLREFISRDDRLQVTVSQTGHVSLPLVQAYPAVGKTTRQLSTELTRLYREQGLERADVSVWVDVPRSRVVRIMGEVLWPGSYPIYGQGDLWGMIALAGGFTRQADSRNVRVINRSGTPPKTYDFSLYIETGASDTTPILTGDEFIYVPAVP